MDITINSIMLKQLLAHIYSGPLSHSFRLADTEAVALSHLAWCDAHAK